MDASGCTLCTAASSSGPSRANRRSRAEEREAAVAAVEEKICAHAETFAAKSYRNVDIYFGPGAPQAVVDAFTKARR